MTSAKERTGRQQACDVDGCPGCEDCPGGRHYERAKANGQHSHIRVRTYGLPMTVDRMYPSANVPTDWLPPYQPSIAHGFPGHYAAPVQVASTIGGFMHGALAHFYQVR